jgi:hypothetical protein
MAMPVAMAGYFRLPGTYLIPDRLTGNGAVILNKAIRATGIDSRTCDPRSDNVNHRVQNEVTDGVKDRLEVFHVLHLLSRIAGSAITQLSVA